MVSRKVIYTALVGDYDLLPQPEVVRSDYDYVCFSNEFAEGQCGVWQIRRIDYYNQEGVRICRYVKMHPHLLLPEYEYSVWLDCNQRLTEEHYRRADQLIESGAVCAMVIHPERDCVYQEAYALSGYLTGDPEKVYQQTLFLLSHGFPERMGLYVTCCMLLQHQNIQIKDFLDRWWRQCEQFSCRDQMGVMYALTEAGVKPSVFFPRDYWDKYRFPHAVKLPRYSFMQRAIRFAARRFYLLRLRLLFRRHGILGYDWHKVHLITMK